MEITQLLKADTSVIDKVCAIIANAKDDMRLLGRTQWQDGYPAPENIIDDINRQCGYILISRNNREPIAYAALILSGDPHYASINGQWITPHDAHYAVIHRLAINPSFKGNGLASHFITLLENQAKESSAVSMRIDTNYDNAGMLRIMEKLHYQYTGIVTLPTGTRQAYEKLL